MPREALLLVFVQVALILFLGLVRPNLICEHANFLVFVHENELFRAKDLPDNPLAIEIEEKYGRIPAVGNLWLGPVPAAKIFLILAADVLLHIRGEDHCLAIDSLAINCVYDCWVRQLLLFFVIGSVDVTHKLVKHTLLLNSRD